MNDSFILRIDYLNTLFIKVRPIYWEVMERSDKSTGNLVLFL